MVPFSVRRAVLVGILSATGCWRSAGVDGAGGLGGAAVTGQGGLAMDAGSDASPVDCTPPPPSELVGWAAVAGDGGVATTTGGGNVAPVTVTTVPQLAAVVERKAPAVIYVRGQILGTTDTPFNIGSNKTIIGLCGAEVVGHLELSHSVNVIIRNLKITGLNCTDSPTDCSAGADAVTIVNSANHIWLDHLDISDGSDGNVDITHGSDFVTVSWTKFHYSGRRAGDHQFCNLIGHDDANAAEDVGHLNVTFSHVWWADNIDQRMPRVRFGQVHVFNSLYTASGDSACIEAGVSCNIRSENNVFLGVRNTVNITHADMASIVESIGNQGSSIDLGGPSFVPPYSYLLDPTESVAAAVMAGAGPQ